MPVPIIGILCGIGIWIFILSPLWIPCCCSENSIEVNSIKLKEGAKIRKGTEYKPTWHYDIIRGYRYY